MPYMSHPPYRSDSAQQLHSLVMQFFRGEDLNVESFIALIKQADVVTEKSCNGHSILHDIINIAFDRYGKSTFNWRDKSEQCHYLMGLLFSYADPLIIKKMMLTEDWQSGAIPSCDLFMHHESVWKKYFYYITTQFDGDQEIRKELVKKIFTHRVRNKKVSGANLLVICLKASHPQDIIRYFEALELALDRQWLDKDNLNTLFSDALILGTKTPYRLYYCLDRLEYFKKKYDWQPDYSYQNQQGFDFLSSLIANHKRSAFFDTSRGQNENDNYYFYKLISNQNSEGAVNCMQDDSFCRFQKYMLVTNAYGDERVSNTTPIITLSHHFLPNLDNAQKRQLLLNISNAGYSLLHQIANIRNEDAMSAIFQWYFESVKELISPTEFTRTLYKLAGKNKDSALNFFAMFSGSLETIKQLKQLIFIMLDPNDAAKTWGQLLNKQNLLGYLPSNDYDESEVNSYLESERMDFSTSYQMNQQRFAFAGKCENNELINAIKSIG